MTEEMVCEMTSHCWTQSLLSLTNFTSCKFMGNQQWMH